MRIGLFLGDLSGPTSTTQDAVAAAKHAADAGFVSFWVPQIFGLDAMTTLAVIGTHVPEIELGTAVIPIYPRHATALAQQTLTAQSASNGRITLGVGLSHQLVIEHLLGYSFDRPATYMHEYLQALAPLLRGEQTDVATERVTTHMKIDVAVPKPPGLLVAALGKRMLEIAAEFADGTITWMTGARTLADHTVPTLHAAPGGAGKRVVAALPVAVTDDRDGAKERAASVFSIYGQLPSYRAMLDREGASGPQDVALVGSERDVQASIEGLFASGVTEFVAVPFLGGSDGDRTLALLTSLL